MGMQQPKAFAQPAPIGANSAPNSLVTQSQQAPQLPGNGFMPLVQDAIPYVQSPNSVPALPGVSNNPNDPSNPQYGQFPYGNLGSTSARYNYSASKQVL